MDKMKNRVILAAYVDADEKAAFARVAIKQERTPSNLVRSLVRQEIKRMEKEK